MKQEWLRPGAIEATIVIDSDSSSSTSTSSPEDASSGEERPAEICFGLVCEPEGCPVCGLEPFTVDSTYENRKAFQQISLRVAEMCQGSLNRASRLPTGLQSAVSVSKETGNHQNGDASCTFDSGGKI